MKLKTIGILLSALLMTTSAWSAKVGAPAPAFTGTTSQGKPVSLSDYKGKFVVLEWHNKECPYVKAHYESKQMQKLQKEWTKKGVIWLTINSSAQGKQGFVSNKEAEAQLKKDHSEPTAYVIDPEGKIGTLYSAQTTPHMFVINPEGNLIYNGAIDDHETTDKKTVPNSKNYVSAALTEAMEGKAVSQPTTRPYGCGVKYKK
jgi:peroxiredoxin